jgi:GNAT superfamily N-acetyltransferase
VSTHTRWHLVMDGPADLRPARTPEVEPAITRVTAPAPELGRFFYTAVGWRWHWVDRLPWALAEWERLQTRQGFEFWTAWLEGAPVGYYELDRHEDGTTEILLFGLLPAFIGQGLGGHLLTHAVQRAWQEGTKRVILNTCSLDHPAAKDAYLARGFHLERTEAYEKALPPAMDGPWPGAEVAGPGGPGQGPPPRPV